MVILVEQGNSRALRPAGVFRWEKGAAFLARFAKEKGKARSDGTATPAQSERKNAFLPRNDRPYGLNLKKLQVAQYPFYK
ncbi:hypothetical protein [uncultured Desulfovibrio sp.]|uniref:hypothetical protein n=1 Tax=uncultured Desulfovibrio sp. TaxID=167968 RepID=UPI0026233225|nr:hypothetical protein [uncultured Desulfovibrio sp.]